MKRGFSDVGTSRVMALALLLALVLPSTFLLVHTFFQGSDSLSKNVVLEELTKGLIGLVASISVVLISETFVRRQRQRESSALRRSIYERIELNRDLLSHLVRLPSFTTFTALDANLVATSVETIRQNNSRRKEFERLSRDICSRLELILDSLMLEEPELRASCQDFQSALHRTINAIEDYFSLPSADTASLVKHRANEVLILEQ